MSVRAERLGALGTIYDGPHATPVRRDHGAYFLNISSLESGRLDLKKSDHVSTEDFEKWTRRVRPQEGDLLFSYETRLGDAALMPGGVEACLGRRMALIRPNRHLVDPKFLLYAWLSPWFKGQIESKAIRGATVDRIPLNQLSEWTIPYLRLAEQRAIGKVLGALDDKIAANRSLIRLADLLVRADYGRLQISDSSLGSIAVNVRKSSSCADISADEPYVGLEHVGRKSLWLETQGVGASISSSKSRFVRGDTLFGKLRPYFHKVALASFAGVCSTDILVIRAREVSQSMLVAAAASSDAVVAAAVQASNGTKMPRAKWTDIARCRVPDPSTSEAQEFCRTAGLIAKRAMQANAENQRLATTRDELLPELMSGKITIKEAEKTVEEVV